MQHPLIIIKLPLANNLPVTKVSSFCHASKMTMFVPLHFKRIHHHHKFFLLPEMYEFQKNCKRKRYVRLANQSFLQANISNKIVKCRYKHWLYHLTNISFQFIPLITNCVYINQSHLRHAVLQLGVFIISGCSSVFQREFILIVFK